jgi:putative Holliday junction resolvase
MPILEINEFKNLREQKRRIIALDLGEKSIGVAISDESWIIGSPLKTINGGKFTAVANEIIAIINEFNAIGVLIGIPQNMDGTDSQKAQSHKQFGRNLLKIFETNVCFVNERASTMQAEEILHQADFNYTKRKTLIDKMAASIILQGFLEA